MSTLAEILTETETRPRVVEACTQLVATEVKSKRGFSGAAVKAGYKVVTAVKPTIVPEVVNKLLPEFAAALEPFYVRSQASGSIETEILADKDAATQALLGVTDRRAQKVSGTLRKAYDRLRGTAETHVAAALPNLGKALGQFV
ncbi:MAG: DUF6918 family protein [Nannocystaceae bacterium]